MPCGYSYLSQGIDVRRHNGYICRMLAAYQTRYLGSPVWVFWQTDQEISYEVEMPITIRWQAGRDTKSLLKSVVKRKSAKAYIHGINTNAIKKVFTLFLP